MNFRAQKHPFERVATPYQVYSWLSPHISHTVDSIRAEDGKGYALVLLTMPKLTLDTRQYKNPIQVELKSADVLGLTAPSITNFSLGRMPCCSKM